MNLSEKVKGLVNKELDKAIKKWGLNHSYHEGYAVLLEEIEEAKDEMDLMEMLRIDIWECTKNDDPETAVARADDLATHAIAAAVELIQVAAMAEKYGIDRRKLVGRNTR